jgi:hypothetical protein
MTQISYGQNVRRVRSYTGEGAGVPIPDWKDHDAFERGFADLMPTCGATR